MPSDEITKLADSFDALLEKRRKQRTEAKEKPKIKSLGEQIEEEKVKNADEKDETSNTLKEEENNSDDLIDAIEDVVGALE